MSKKSLNNKEKDVIRPIYISLILGSFFIIFTVASMIIINGVNNYNYFSIIQYNLFIFPFIFGTIFLFIYTIIYKIILNGTADNMALKLIAICTSITLGFTFLLINIPNSSFVKIFENSIGYLISSFFGSGVIDKTFQFKNKEFDNFKMNKNVLLTLFDINNFNNLYDNINDNNILTNFTIDNSSNIKNEFHKLVIQKNRIGILSWYYITSFMTVLICLKYLIRA